MTRIVLAGGGTGGHTVAARVIGDVARSEGFDTVWVGRPTSFEERVAAESGHRFIAAEMARPTASMSYLRVLRRVRSVLRDIRPDLVVATGGWVGAPVALAAVSLRIPLVCHEQTLIPGRATSLLSLFARSTWLTFPGAAAHLRWPRSTVVTGFPLRGELREQCSAEKASALLGISRTAPMLFVAGGGGGAESLNRFVADNLPTLLADWQIVHQAGGGSGLTTTAEALERLRDELPGRLRDRYVVAAYLNAGQVNAALRRADLVLGRSGAGFVNEVLELRAPAVFVPYPHARNDEQTALAREAMNTGAGVAIWPDHDVATQPDRLIAELRKRAYLRESHYRAGSTGVADRTIAEALRAVLR
ncbi:UDP-N-acetylglucosamine--N-acetylmuramyl-(pentapeptide) pyrophosphoryl-undecaprenol N-acetylglucosamine transferase [Mycobacterium koreense]|nr:UDP-N-acetylglucosamine--N-acetylmuramyl-(pentapeptide) pyrophosphoryl-undecaprenol N-acetylglucosamine transferase [Mycolicibacillus koreensis]MCV7247546.1 UDP-N-acetylglucosamine--N-acetylmuramyl-(pentapeptide) pyrophosphoryl-undecaprenol N-acetylglucosamine transferase [Mycolicibacillus koreensis]BBY53925.1 undecaprenyldiphospho-muramoylpentapeptide beta-N- acetylglucosaminyltransferase [Mycolicibacillus koreensis]